MVDVGNDDEPEAMDVDVEDKRPVLTTLEAEGHLDELRRHVAKLGNFHLTQAVCWTLAPRLHQSFSARK
jgi:hypothetical protein